MSGCPFAGKNTGSSQSLSGQDIEYESLEDSYSLPIISPYEALVSLYRRDQFESKEEFLKSRKGFMSLSPHLQNSLFHPKHTRKLRHKEIMEKFIVFADLKNAGNVEYRKKDYMKALSLHEQAYCLFQYLEWTHEDEDFLESSITDSDFEFRESIPKDAQEEKILRDIMGTCLLNMAACALRLSSFPYAVSLCTEAVELMPDSHLAYARRAQARICNLETRIEELELGIRDAERAKNMELKPEYVDLMAKGKERVTKEEAKERDFFQAFFKSVASFGWVQSESQSEELELEHRVIKRMLEKYREMLKFYEECDKREKLSAIRQEMQGVASVYIKMNWIHGISVTAPSSIMQEEAQRAGVSLEDPKVRGVVDSVKRMNISSCFSGPKYNDQLLKYCIDLTVDEDKRRTRSRQRGQKQTGGWSSWIFALLVLVTSWGIYYFLFRKPANPQFPGK